MTVLQEIALLLFAGLFFMGRIWAHTKATRKASEAMLAELQYTRRRDDLEKGVLPPVGKDAQPPPTPAT